jgi:hypothetical protein
MRRTHEREYDRGGHPVGLERDESCTAYGPERHAHGDEHRRTAERALE